MTVRRTDEPHDEMTEICSDLLAALEDHPNGVGVKAIVMLSRKEEDGGVICGIGAHGFEDDQKLVDQLFKHVTSILKSYGTDLHIAVIPKVTPENN